MPLPTTNDPRRQQVRHDRSNAGWMAALAWWLVALAAGPLFAQAAAPRYEFTRMVAHWDAYGDPRYLEFIDEARPELVQLGFYGAHFWSIAHTPAFGGYPAHFPVRGLPECGDWFARRNQELKSRGVKVVGHFNVEFLVGDPDGPDGPRGFFKFYRDLWDEKELGPRPVANPLDLLEKNADGTPISQAGYGIGGMKEYWACLRNPHWQQVLKAWVRRGIERGVDGYMINYFYRHNCLCDHCQQAFRRYLRSRYSADELQQQLGIDNLDSHRFSELVAWHDPRASTPLRREMLRFSQISNKQVFDEVLVRYGRSLRPDLIVGQWNHLGNFAQVSGDERCLLPAELWGRDETYAWYSTGDSAYFSDLQQRVLGEGTLQARYLRGALDDKPFTLGKYEGTRIRAAIAELAANGGAPMGFYARFTDPAARAEFARYYGFLRRYQAWHHACRSHAEVVLLFPRRAVQRGDLVPLERFRNLGTQLLDSHVLFDIVPDDLTSTVTGGVKIGQPELGELDDEVKQRIAGYRHVVRADQPGEIDPAAWPDISRFKAPFSVRVAANRPAAGSDLTLHLVNYDRTEPPMQNGKPSPGAGIQDERPRAVQGVEFDLMLPPGLAARGVSMVTPESPEPQAIAFQTDGGRVRGRLPEFLVYSVVHFELHAP